VLDKEIPVHPVQMMRPREGTYVRTEITLRAYEVYKVVYGEQKALITDGCRGGFSVGELIAFLYAHSFPQTEWRQRTDEAFKNMRLG
jgi:hypothetical protein